MQAGELAAKLGVHLNTLRTWERLLGVQVPRDRLGNRVYEESVVALFEQVAQLRQDEKPLDQIRDELKEDIAAFSTEIPELLGRFNDTTRHLADQMAALALHNQKLLEEIKHSYSQVDSLQEREKNLMASLDRQKKQGVSKQRMMSRSATS